MFTDKATRPLAFQVAALLKKQASTYAAAHLVDTDTGEILDPYTDRGQRVTYYRFNHERALPSRAVCVDIRAAYPTTLRNLGIIDSKAFGMLMALPKADRLKAVGMLAATKYRQEFEQGRAVTGIERDAAPTSWAFFTICHEVGRVMERLREELGAAFLHFWVDGVFVEPGAEAVAEQYLSAAGYETTTEQVDNLRRSNSGRYIFYTKGGARSYLCVPQRSTFDERELLHALADAPNL